MRASRTLGIATLIMVLAGANAFSAPPSTEWKEVIRPEEQADFARAAKMMNDFQRHNARKHNDGQIDRGLHAKAHFAGRAQFRILEDIPEYARHGLFAEPGTYDCYARLSNGQGFIQRDRKGDARGLAIKVVGVEGHKLIPGQEHEVTQDLLMTNVPINPARDGNQFIALIDATKSRATLLPKLIRALGVKEAYRIIKFSARAVARKTISAAAETYWSGASIKLGPYAVKYFARPAGPIAPKEHLFGSADYLREDLKERLTEGNVKFNIFLQFYTDDKNTPVEDPSVEWLESKAPPIKVAELVISERDMNSSLAQAEEAFTSALSFTPWHGLESMRPLGHIQRTRLAVYGASSGLRTHTREPDGSEEFDQ